MPRLFPTQQLARIAARLENFEASASRPNTGTGSRREGDQFEHIGRTFWSALASYLASHGAHLAHTSIGRRTWTRITMRSRSLYLPVHHQKAREPHGVPELWLRLKYPISDIVEAYPGQHEAIKRYAPSRGPFAGPRYPNMYEGLSTTFDDAILLEEAGILREKILVEYKTAKSSKRRQIDGNAHERLSFQIMQYLEIATRYPRCTLVVLTNGAFVRYRNKYHVSFHIQRDRMAAFSWFRMEYLCERRDYARFVRRLIDWFTSEAV